MDPPKLRVNLTISTWLIHCKVALYQNLVRFRLCDLTVVTSCEYRWEITDTDMGAIRITEIRGGGVDKTNIKAQC